MFIPLMHSFDSTHSFFIWGSLEALRGKESCGVGSPNIGVRYYSGGKLWDGQEFETQEAGQAFGGFVGKVSNYTLKDIKR